MHLKTRDHATRTQRFPRMRGSYVESGLCVALEVKCSTLLSILRQFLAHSQQDPPNFVSVARVCLSSRNDMCPCHSIVFAKKQRRVYKPRKLFRHYMLYKIMHPSCCFMSFLLLCSEILLVFFNCFRSSKLRTGRLSCALCDVVRSEGVKYRAALFKLAHRFI